MDSDNESYHSKSEFYYPDEEIVLKENKTFRNTSNSSEDELAFKAVPKKKINMLFAVLGWSVLGKTVLLVLSTASRPRHSFSQYRPPGQQITYISFYG